MSEVFITGTGLITCLGNSVRETWDSLVRNEKGILPVAPDLLAGCKTQWGGQARSFTPPALLAEADRSIQFAAVATREAISNAGLSPDDLREYGDRAAVVIGSSKGGVVHFAQVHRQWLKNIIQPGGGLDTFWTMVPPCSCSEIIARQYAVSGPCLCPVAACTTGAIAVIRAAQLILENQADLVICGASDACIHPLWIAAFDRMGVLAPSHSRFGVSGACRPFDIDRGGFAVSEGAGILILESQKSVWKRGFDARICIRGYAMGSDSDSITSYNPHSTVLSDIIQTSIQRSRLRLDEIDVINAHGTATTQNDFIEAAAWKKIYGNRRQSCPVVATKGAIGHALGAAGSIELALCVEMLRRQTVLPTANYCEPAADTANLSINNQTGNLTIGAICKVSLGFGGHIASIIMTKQG